MVEEHDFDEAGRLRDTAEWKANWTPDRFPTGLIFEEVADEISRRLVAIFETQPDGTRPLYGGTEKFQRDPHWRENLLFYEYFHGDNGAGIGASHQTGWTGLVAVLIEQLARQRGAG